MTSIGKFIKPIVHASVTVAIAISIAVSATHSVRAEEAKDVPISSIMGDFFNPTLGVTLTDGDILVPGAEEREKINDEIAAGIAKESYSLYDRFGPNISFVPYYGEIKINVNIFDKFYSYFINNNADVSFTNEIKEFFSNDSYEVNNVVYENRVDIINDERDPRYAAWVNASTTGGKVALGNFYLTIAKVVNDVSTFFISGAIIDELHAFIKDLFDEETVEYIKSIMPIINVLLTLFFIGNLCRWAIKYLKTASITFSSIVWKVVASLLSMSILITIVNDPLIILPAMEKIGDIKEAIVQDTFSPSIDNDVVRCAKDPIAASIWYINVFDPWCKGTFGTTYDKLHTKYAIAADGVSEEDTMPMSNDNILEPFEGEKRYSCAQVVGDVTVPVGGGKVVRNWAALAWSLQSIYHIGAIDGAGTTVGWPKAEVTVKNPSIYVDNFRLIDAMLNVSEEYEATGETTGNVPVKGPNVPRSYDVSGIPGAGLQAIFRSTVLTFPIALLAGREIVYAVKLAFSFVSIAIASITYIIKGEGEVWERSIDGIVGTAFNVIVNAIGQAACITLYGSTYGSAIGNVAYAIVATIIVIELPSWTKRERRWKRRINRFIYRKACSLRRASWR